MIRWLVALLLILVPLGAVRGDETPRVRAELRLDGEAWVGQRVPFVVELSSPTWFAGTPAFDLPTVPGAVVMGAGDRPVQGTEQIGGHTFTRQRYEFAVFPQRAGTVTIPSFAVRFGVATPGGGPPTEHEQATETLTFTAVLPPGAEGRALVASARNLTVEVSWQPQPGDASVGDAFTRTVTFRADDLPGMAFPPLPEVPVPGLGIYPANPRVEDRTERGAFTGVRVETVTYVCEQPGTATLPALSLTWWDLDAQRLRTIEVEAATFRVAGSPPPVEATGNGSSLWPGYLALGIMLLVAGGLWFVYGPGSPRRRAARDSPEARAYRRFQDASRGGDGRRTLCALYAWLAHVPGRPGLDDLATAAGDPALVELLAALDAAAYGPATAPAPTIPGGVLRRGAARARAQWTGTVPGDNDRPLTPLNPRGAPLPFPSIDRPSKTGVPHG